jgi:Putative auto-transporter adhesin, head GIN domain
VLVAPDGGADGGAAGTPVHGVGWWTGRVGRAMTILAAVGVLAGCQGTSAGGTPGTGGTGAPGTGAPGTCTSGGNGYGGKGGDANGGSGNGGSGGTGGNGGNGYGGCGSNGYGGNGGNANGGDGAPGAAGSDGADGAPGGSFPGSGSGAVAGSGRLTSRTIDVSRVTSVMVGTNFVVHLKTGSPAQATVRMDDNLVDRVDATVTGDQLRLGIKPGMGVRNATLTAEITVGQLDRLATSGASRVQLDSPVTSPALELVAAGASTVSGPVTIGQVQATISGASTLALSGQVQDLRLSAAGASQLPLFDLTVRRLDMMLSGACHANVTVSDTLAAQASGASVLRFRGTPAITRSQTSGMSSIAPDSP